MIAATLLSFARKLCDRWVAAGLAAVPEISDLAVGGPVRIMTDSNDPRSVRS